MSISHSPKITTSGLVMCYDVNNKKSFRGKPTNNAIISSSLTQTIYAYATGPVVTTGILDEYLQARTVNRFTISSAINTARGMYQIYGLAAGVDYAASMKWKYNGAHTPVFQINASKGIPEGGANNNTFTSAVQSDMYLGNGWWYSKYEFNFASNPTNAAILTFGIATGDTPSYIGQTFDTYEEQFEVQRTATPYAYGIRSNVGSFYDLTETTTANTTAVTWLSNNTINYDGVSSVIALPNTTALDSQTQSVEVWVKPNSLNQNGHFFEKGTVNSQYSLFLEGTNIVWRHNIAGTGLSSLYSTTSSLSTSRYNQIVGTFASNIARRIYVNGSQVNSDSASGNVSISSGGMSIGAYGGFNGSRSYFYNGNIAIVRVYNRMLSPEEVQQNYDAMRGRFDL
jgi:hypothetical protein